MRRRRYDGAAHSWPFGDIAVTVLGVLMLDTRFPRVVGDIGNPETFDHPVRYAVVRGASPQRVVRERDLTLLQPFIDAGLGLVRDGATAITTSCGFLLRFQHELQAAFPVPVWTSSLLLLAELTRAGVVTIDAASLDMIAATPVEGITPGCAFQRTLLENRPTLDTDDARQQVVGAAERLVARHPALTDIVLECTNMPPYADAVRRATGRRVHDITTLIAARLAASAS